MPKRVLLGILTAGICLVAARAASGVPPQQVSPTGLVELRCPTFSWSGTAGAAGYELLVYEVLPAGEVGKEPLLSVRLPGGAASWTPPGASCLGAGGRYAWTLRVLGNGAEGGWAESVLFEVAAAPSLGEVEAALATLRRYLGEEQDGRPRTSEPDEVAESGIARRGEAVAVAERLREAATSRVGGEGPRSVTAAAVPSLGTPSLTVDSNVALGGASNLFKDGSVFLWDDTTGNTALGRLALASATGSATNNTAFGRDALRHTVSEGGSQFGSHNTALGDRALRSNTTGFRNTASGYRALYFNTTGTHNTASGFEALFNNIGGSFNTASGQGALRANTTGHRNTASGYGALFANTDGYRNTANGHGALGSNTSGVYNTASGDRALNKNETGNRNTAIGDRALFSNTGSFNTASGQGALQKNTTGIRNTASGYAALHENTTGYSNTAIGQAALHANNLGARNTAVGTFAGGNATTGDDNIFLGSGAAGVAGEGNTIRIGGLTGTSHGQQNRTFIAGIAGIGVSGAAVQVDAATGQLGVAVSSARFKEEIEDLDEIGERLAALRPVTFRYRPELVAGGGGLEVGLIAEEVAELFPELATRDPEGRPHGVRYDLLSVLLLREMTTLREQVEALEAGGLPAPERSPWWRRGGATVSR